MKKIVVASVSENSGKTSVIAGIGQALRGKIGYLKPFGDRLIYRKKRLWDYDAALLARIFQLEEKPEDITIGFRHAKLNFMMDPDTARERFREILDRVSPGCDLLLAEGGKNLTHGLSIHLDPLSLRRFLDGTLLFVVNGGEEDGGLDELLSLRRCLAAEPGRVAGVIINKIVNMDDYREVFLPRVELPGIPILGLLPFRRELDCLSARHLSDRFFAKVLAGEEHLDRRIENIFAMAMEPTEAEKHPLFSAAAKLVITSGDNTDMIAAALKGDTACILLTDGLRPPAELTSRAREQGVPLLLVSMDILSAVRQVDRIPPLLTPDDADKIRLLKDLVVENVRLESLRD
jgi:BioD-like phosphotransacetylase family protein